MAKLSKVEDKDKSNVQWKQFKHKGLKADCQHCKFNKAEDSIPENEFTVRKRDSNGKDIGPRVVKEITIFRGRYGDCIGWFY